MNFPSGIKKVLFILSYLMSLSKLWKGQPMQWRGKSSILTRPDWFWEQVHTEHSQQANRFPTAMRYWDVVLRKILRSYARAGGLRFLMVQHTNQPHVDTVCRLFLDDEGTDANDRPSRSADLIPIEPLWDIHFMYLCICTITDQPTDALIQVFGEIPDDTIGWLMRSTPRCC